ncbi:1-deoxy-D-xylulose-5-phosphate reductoisomerase [Candidatus Pelagibacter ubique]|uniref:1-deoxy-D-xylulose-5-phosphate reductoisomerase n=1 Tax=Pelagibacter ubique TaxID=198252 RepID=UPI0003C7E1C4
MKKKIAILGSTGSIGDTLIKIINQNKKNFEIKLLTANTNYKKLLKQANQFNVENIIITNKKNFLLLKKINKNKKIKIFNNFDCLDKIFNKKIDYVMSSIIGIQGLLPTFKIIRFTKNIAIANKESIICGWKLIEKELKKNKTLFVPVDSEHFSLWFGLNKIKVENVEKFFLTASGGPLYKTSLSKFRNINKSLVLNHPNWRMGKKITIDSATMINKVFEVIEAKNIFNISYKQIKILIHPNSYVHALIKFNNGITKIIIHDTTMKIPIFNTLFLYNSKKLPSKNLDIKTLNNLAFNNVDKKKYPMINILNLLPKNHSLFETVIVSANDTLVELFLADKIKFKDIYKMLMKILTLKEFNKLKKRSPQSIKEILDLDNYVRLKIIKKSI